MFSNRRRGVALLGAALFLVTACGGGATTAPSSAPTETPGGSTAPASVAPVATIVATVTDAELITAGRLTVCSDIPYPPLEFFDAQGNPTGSDIDLGAEIAKRLGLVQAVNNTVFTTIIPALQGSKCDIIISDQNITTDRIKQVDMIPYFQAGQAFVVAKGNPKAINTTDDLCGKTIAAETGTTEVDYLEGTGAYVNGKGLSAACVAKGRPAIVTKQFDKDSLAALALQSGQVDSYFADFPVAANYANSKPDSFELAPVPQLAPAIVGMSVLPDPAHKNLEKAVQTALISMINDGTYLTILKNYKDDAGAVTAAQAQQINKTTLP
jgi:polar amino acid transport system substrate-binding protein